MKSYELIPHVADVRLKLEADNLKELFAVAIEGMAHLSKPDAFKKEPSLKEPSLRDEIYLSSVDVTLLLIDFMSAVLTLMHVKKAVYYKAEFMELDETNLKAVVYGFEVSSFDEDIKAVTYHEAEIQKTKSGYSTVIVFDI